MASIHPDPDGMAVPRLPAAWLARGLALRHEHAHDLSALREMFREQRWSEFAALPWDDMVKAALLDQQFDAQRRDYARSHPDARWLVLTEHGQIMGRLYLASESESTLRILDIALRAACRGQGIGRALIGALQAQARHVRLQVYKDNPAAALYRRLGFREVADTGVAWQMQWDQPVAAPVS